MRQQRRFQRDAGLSARMLLTMFLLGLVYVAFIAALLQAGASVLFVALVAGGLLLVQLLASDRIALLALGAREVGPDQAPRLHGLVDRVCALADMPKPRLGVVTSDLPNAFATGRSRKAAVLCATTGLMRRLDDEELEAVLAHELSHVAHRDAVVMTVASFLGVLAGLLTRFLAYAGLFGSGGRSRDQASSPLALILLVSVAVYAVSFLLIRALSRYRELAADRAGALLLGRPSALAAALVKVTGAMGRIPTQDLRAAEPFNAFFFAPALAKGASLTTLLSTHPSLQQRLDQLARLEAQLGGPA